MNAATAAEDPARPGLSRDRILDAAGELLASGRGRFSMRRLAESLDVTPMALYRWFDSKDDLLGALTERLVTSTSAAGSVEGPWLERAVAYSIEIRQNLLRHLPLLRIEGASRRLTANVVRYADGGLQLMLDLGYRERAAVDAYRVLFWSVLDFCLVIDATDALPTAAQSNEVFARVTEAEGEDLAERMPALAALLPFFTDIDPDSFFERSVRAVLTGLMTNVGSLDPSD